MSKLHNESTAKYLTDLRHDYLYQQQFITDLQDIFSEHQRKIHEKECGLCVSFSATLETAHDVLIIFKKYLDDARRGIYE